ncbi:hypothetical protein ABZX95_14495 [Streptomyces sp. NPDC004232]|uniref:hypothetical protein n=1 Tax=Streptomyces sp. NPDC004232 TaxID=3154454 RepID=UPI0033A53548
MSGPPAGSPVRAAWSLQGKAPGQVAYDVQAGSVEPRIAQKYFWAASTETPRAERAHVPDALPWVAFLGGTEAGRPVTGLVETVWSGGRDATGRISYSARLLLLDWQPAGDAGLTWTSLYDAALDTAWPAVDADAAHPPHLVLAARPAGVAQLARYIEEDIGFEWAARSAALLLEGRHVAITLSPEHAGLSAVTRVAVLDGICALLPYGSRAWLSAATWAGHGADHELRLTFALRPRGSQCHAVLAGPPPQGPGSAQGRAYLAELLRLRQKVGIEALLTHLLSHRAPLTPQDAEQALRHLRDLDLRAVVVSDIERGAGQLGDVARLLSLHPLASLDEREAATVARHLARCTLPGAPPGALPEAERAQARALLLEHWSAWTGAALADELNSWPVERQTVQRVRAVLDLAAASRDRQAHAAVLAGYLDAGTAAEAPDGLLARGALLHAVQRGLDESTVAAVQSVLPRRPELALAWLDVNAEHRTLDDRLVRDLLRRPGEADRQSAPDWLHGAALIHREPSAGPDGQGIEAFAGISPTAWRTGLRLAAHAGNPDVLCWLHPELYEVAAGLAGTDEDRGFLLRRVDVLVPKQRGVAGRHAAWADLIQLPLLGSVQRARLFADDGAAGAEYAGVLRQQLPHLGLRGRGEGRLAEGLVGERLDQVPYPLLWELTHPQEPGAEGLVGLEGPLLDRIAELLRHAGDWLTRDMPAPWEQRLRDRPDLQWLAHTADIRRLVAARTAAPEHLGDAIVRASPHSRYAEHAQQTVEFPSAVLDAIRPWLHEHAGRGDFVHRLAGHLNRTAPHQALGDLLYYSVSQLRFGEPVRQRALDCHRELKDSVEHAIKLLRQKPSRQQPTAPPPFPGQAGSGGAHRPSYPPVTQHPAGGRRSYPDPAHPASGTSGESERGVFSRLLGRRGRGEDRV